MLNESKVMKELKSKERGFNKVDSLINSSRGERTSDGYVIHNSILTTPIVIDYNNTFLMPSELEFLGINEKEFVVGKDILGLHDGDNEGFKFEKTNVSKYVVTSDRLYEFKDDFISSDWATPIIVMLDDNKEEFISIQYFEDKDDATLVDYIKEYLNMDIDAFLSTVLLNKNGVIIIKVVNKDI